jgi:hypothetical protein
MMIFLQAHSGSAPGVLAVGIRSGRFLFPRRRQPSMLILFPCHDRGRVENFNVTLIILRIGKDLNARFARTSCLVKKS